MHPCNTSSWVAGIPHCTTHTLQIVALALVGAPVIYAWGCLYAAITGAPVSLGVFKVVSAAGGWHGNASHQGISCSMLTCHPAISSGCCLSARFQTPSALPSMAGAVHGGTAGPRRPRHRGDVAARRHAHQRCLPDRRFYFRGGDWSVREGAVGLSPTSCPWPWFAPMMPASGSWLSAHAACLSPARVPGCRYCE